MAKAKKTTKTKKASKSFSLGVKGGKYQAVGGAKLKDKDIKSEREKRKRLREKERKIQRKYKQGWDLSTGTWKEGFLDDWYDCE